MGKHEINGEGMAAWKAANLPGRPTITVRGGLDKDLPVEQVIADPKGKAVLLHGSLARAEHAAAVMGEHLERAVQVVYFFHPELHHLDVFGFALARIGAGRTLSLPERAAVAALADYCARYRPGMKAAAPLALPRVLQDETELAGGYISDFLDESRAYMLADACKEVFCVDAEVVDDGNGWTVVLRGDETDAIGTQEFAELHGVCRLLQRFAITASPMDERIEAPASRPMGKAATPARWDEMANALADIRESLERIEGRSARAEKPKARNGRSAS